MPDASSARALIRRSTAFALFGCLAVVLADVIAWAVIVENYSPISETISALAVGPGSWLLDLGLWLLAGGCVALGIAMYRWRPDGSLWVFGSVAVMLLGPDIGVIALFNEYAGTRNAGANVHLNAVYVLGVLVALAALLVVPALKMLDDRLGRRSLWFGIAWVVLAPIFFIVPDSWNGAYERALALMLLSWITGLATLAMKHT